MEIFDCFKNTYTISLDSTITDINGVTHKLSEMDYEAITLEEPELNGIKYSIIAHILRKKSLRTQVTLGLYYINTMVIYYHIEYLLECYAAFRNKKNSDHTQLILIGEKESSYFEQLQMNMSYQKYKKDISFIERVTDEELTRYYLGATAVINVSREEGFCYPVLEASFTSCAPMFSNGSGRSISFATDTPS
jgi:hypothetical protein